MAIVTDFCPSRLSICKTGSKIVSARMEAIDILSLRTLEEKRGNLIELRVFSDRGAEGNLFCMSANLCRSPSSLSLRGWRGRGRSESLPGKIDILAGQRRTNSTRNMSPQAVS